MFYFALWPSVSLIFAHILNLAGTEDFNHPQICVGILVFLLSARASKVRRFHHLVKHATFRSDTSSIQKRVDCTVGNGVTPLSRLLKNPFETTNAL